MERGTYPTLWQWNGKVYLTHVMSAKWKEVLTPLWHPVAVKWKEVLTPPCGSEMERGTYPTLWQWKWKEVLTPPCGSGMERGTYPTLWQ